MRSWPSSLRARLTLWYTVLLGVPLVVFAIVSYVVFARTLEHRTDRFIDEALTAFSRELVAERRAALSVAQAMRSTVDEMRFRDLQIAILDTTGRVLAAGGAAPGAAHGTNRIVSRPLVIDGQTFGLRGTYSLNDIEAVLARVRAMFVIAIPLLILSAATGGYMLAKRSLAPLEAMASRAANISVTTLHERLSVSGGDELVRLANVVNGLLDRLELSFTQQRRFATDASHELRTPTAIVRTEADVTLSQPHRTEDEYRVSIAIMSDAARRLTRIVDDLFLLARADSGHLVPRDAELYLDELVHDATSVVRSVAEQRTVCVVERALIEAPFRGDADLLGRLLLNLLDNAIKHSPEGGTVEVAMARRDEHYEISVVDAGPGIPTDAHARVFERFFRVDAARARTDNTATSGAGLGLAIARRIAELHAGRLELAESAPGRTEFRVVLPAAQ